MIHKNITLLAHCKSCLSVLFKQHVMVEIDGIETMPLANNMLRKMFPLNITCKTPECACTGIDYSYTVLHTHKFKSVTPQDEIERCKAQIAATYDYNNNLNKEDREMLRGTFQKQLAKLLRDNNILPQ